jgi:hypothetical protein
MLSTSRSRRALAGAAFVAVLLAGVAPAGAEEGKMVGQVAPDFKIEEWINGSGKTSLKECEGQLVLIELWATT